MRQIVFSYYPGNIYESICQGHVDLFTVIAKQKSGISRLARRVEAIRAEDDKGKRGELKKKLVYFTPSVLIPVGKRRVYDNIERWTGLMQLDFDGEEKIVELKKYLAESFPYIYTAYVSPSGRGVKAIMKMPVVDSVDDYKEHFLAVEEYFTDLGIDSFDHAPFNPILPLYGSFDKEIFYNPDPRTWEERKPLADQSNFQNLSERLPDEPPSFDGEDVYKSMAYFRKITMDIFRKKVQDIIGDPGHPRWRDACLVLGSRMGAGYLSRQDAEALMKNELYTNSYLQKGIKGYLRTGYWALEQGNKNPRYYG